jgi:hypothetical protein
MVRKYVVAGALGAVAFLAAGPLQHVGAVPETALGNASKSTIKAALNIGVKEAWGSCGGGSGRSKGNNGFGNGGFDGVPGGSSHQDATR